MSADRVTLNADSTHADVEAYINQIARDQGYLRLTLEEYEERYGPSLKGRIVSYDEPLTVSVYARYEGKSSSIMPVAEIPKFGSFQRVEGGFGANLSGHGRMIMGPFYTRLPEAISDDRFEFSDEQYAQLLSMVPEESRGRVTGFRLSASTKERPARVYVAIEGGEQ